MSMDAYNQSLLQQRGQVVALALKYGSAFGFREDTIYDGLQLFDRVMCCGVPFNANLWSLALCSCVLLAAHQSEAASCWPQFSTVTQLTGFANASLVSMERNIYVWLHQDISSISALRVVQLYLERLGHYLQEYKPAERAGSEVQAVTLKAANNPVFIGCRPSAVAATALIALRKSKGMVPFWPVALQVMTGYTDLHVGDLAICLSHLDSLM